MPRKTSKSFEAPKENKIFGSIEEIERARKRLVRRVSEVKALADSDPMDKNDIRAVESKVIDSLRETYGADSAEFDRLQHFQIWDGGLYLSMDDGYKQECYRKGVPAAIRKLEALIEALDERKEEMEENDRRPFFVKQESSLLKEPVSKKVFVVHGRNDEKKESTARLIEKLGLEAIILHERDDMGDTIIEKLEREGDVGFAVILLTGDDVGRLKDEANDKLKARARQNVVMEFGYFLGRLGRKKKVCALIDPEVEKPSDMAGLVYKTLDTGGRWKFDLAKELRAAGYPVDLSLVD